MSKVKIFASTVCLSFALSFGGTTVPKAASQDSSTIASYTRSITETTYTYGNVQPKQAIYYSKNGWSGTLYLQSKAFDGTYTIAMYKGNVTCTSGCGMNTLEEKK